MKKQSNRRVRPASEPALVRLATNPEIGIAERMAIQAMRGGFGFDVVFRLRFLLIQLPQAREIQDAAHGYRFTQ